jgi:CHAT domain-containing protein
MAAAAKADSAQSPQEWLRRVVWQPIQSQLPADTHTLLICPDGQLTALPWGALPGEQPDTFLLQRYRFATVPYSRYLVPDGKPATTAGQRPAGTFLLVGNVDYDQSPDAALPDSVAYGLRAAARGADDVAQWPPLPATRHEVEQIASTVGSVEQVVRLEGNRASTARVLEELPRARRAHLATHGFFADPEFSEAVRLDPKLLEARRFLVPHERTTVAGRNPLVLSGLVMAGANLPASTDSLGLPVSDGGIVTAECLAGLPLQGLELVTLSACETGLGDVSEGEGVFGLQRALHTAGARTVVASLWKVDDRATQLLMTTFYENLYRQRMTRLDALRHAQLSILLGQPAQSVDRGLIREPLPPTTSAVRPPAHPRLWAAWTLSGDWQ